MPLEELELRDAIGPRMFVSDGLQAGGAERQLVNLLRGLSLRQNRPPIYLLCLRLAEHTDHRFLVREFEGLDIEVRNVMPLANALQTLSRLCGEVEVRRLQASLMWAPSDIRDDIIRLAAEFLTIRPFVVHGWQDSAGLAAAVAAQVSGVTKTIVATRNVNPTHFEYFRPFMPSLYGRLCAEKNVILTSNSVAGARDYERWLGLATGFIKVIRNGVDERVLRRPPADRIRQEKIALGLPPDAPVVGGMFRLQEEKQPLLWLEVARQVLNRMPSTYFVLYGCGSLGPKIEKASRKLGLDDRFVMAGLTSNPGEALCLFDVLLLTSAQEGTPNVLLEAGLLGVPVVATAAGGTEEAMLPGLTGFLVPPPVKGEDLDGQNYPGQIATAVVKALAGNALRETARCNGPAFIRQTFGLDRMINENEALYRDLHTSRRLN